MTILTNILLLTALTAYLLIVGFVFTGQMNDILKGYHFRPKDAAPDDDYEVLIGGDVYKRQGKIWTASSKVS